MPPRDYFTPRVSKTPGKRRLPRLKTELITCALGEVTNLSMMGLRVHSQNPLKVGDEYAIVLKGYDMKVGPIRATVVWWREGVAGFLFTQAPKSMRKPLSEMAMLARDKNSLPSDESTDAP